MGILFEHFGVADKQMYAIELSSHCNCNYYMILCVIKYCSNLDSLICTLHTLQKVNGKWKKQAKFVIWQISCELDVFIVVLNAKYQWKAEQCPVIFFFLILFVIFFLNNKLKQIFCFICFCITSNRIIIIENALWGRVCYVYFNILVIEKMNSV